MLNFGCGDELYFIFVELFFLFSLPNSTRLNRFNSSKKSFLSRNFFRDNSKAYDQDYKRRLIVNEAIDRRYLEKLDMETRSGIIHGNAKRAFYNKLKNNSSTKKTENDLRRVTPSK